MHFTIGYSKNFYTKVQNTNKLIQYIKLPKLNVFKQVMWGVKNVSNAGHHDFQLMGGAGIKVNDSSGGWTIPTRGYNIDCNNWL